MKPSIDGRVSASASIEPKRMLELGRTGTEAALEQLRSYSTAQIASALMSLEPKQRVEFLETAERVDEIVPHLPEAVLTRTIRSTGIEENGWLVEFATDEQRVAAVDLDCWRDVQFSISRFFEWIDAMIRSGPEILAAAFSQLDSEIWVLAMKHMASFSVVGSEDFYSAEGSTIDGVVYFSAESAESEERLVEILTAALHYAPSQYWRLVYAAIYESQSESEEFAARWQRNRLGDLGFPERDVAMRVYRPLHSDPDLYQEPSVQTKLLHLTSSDHAPSEQAGSVLGRTLRELSEAIAAEVMSDCFSVANALAVADRLPLAEESTAGRSLQKALRGVERGLVELARTQARPLASVLAVTSALDLFRIGATLDTELRHGEIQRTGLHEEDVGDWGRATEDVSEKDQTLHPNGRLNHS